MDTIVDWGEARSDLARRDLRRLKVEPIRTAGQGALLLKRDQAHDVGDAVPSLRPTGSTMTSRITRPTALRALAVAFMGATPIPAPTQEIPADQVRTVFTSDTIPEFGSVGGVTADGLGFVYVADFRNAVWRISPDGEVAKFADGLYGASGNAIGPRGHLFQSSFNGNFIARIDRTGAWEVYADHGLSGPVGIAVNPQGELFVVNCSSDSVAKIGTDRSVTEFVKSDLLACPNGLTFDDRGDLYIVNFNSTKIVRVTPEGEASEFADLLGAGGNGHITFARGAFYITKFRGHQVFRLNRSGEYAVVAGTGQPGEDDGAGLSATFTQPNGITSTAGGQVLWINDLTVRGPATGGRSLVTMRRIDLVTLTQVLADLDPAAGVSDMEALWDAYHVDRLDEDTSADAIAVGYQWLTAGRIGQATALLQRTADHYPESGNAQFHAGEGYRYTGQPAKAAEQYRKALALQPDHPNAKARLAEVTGG